MNSKNRPLIGVVGLFFGLLGIISMYMTSSPEPAVTSMPQWLWNFMNWWVWIWFAISCVCLISMISGNKIIWFNRAAVFMAVVLNLVALADVIITDNPSRHPYPFIHLLLQLTFIYGWPSVIFWDIQFLSEIEENQSKNKDYIDVLSTDVTNEAKLIE